MNTLNRIWQQNAPQFFVTAIFTLGWGFCVYGMYHNQERGLWAILAYSIASWITISAWIGSLKGTLETVFDDEDEDEYTEEN